MQIKNAKERILAYQADKGDTGVLRDGTIVMKLYGDKLVTLSGDDTGNIQTCSGQYLIPRRYILEEIV